MKTKKLSSGSNAAIAVTVAALVAGCVGYVDEGYQGYYSPGVVVEPSVTFYGGYSYHGDWHDYDRRGHASWGAAHGHYEHRH